MNFLEQTVNGIPYGYSEGMAAAGGVAHGFSTRVGGVSQGTYESLNLGFLRGDDRENVLENYRRFCAAIGADVTSLVLSNQVHSDVVRLCTSADRGKGFDIPGDYEADGLMTDVPGLGLVVFGADCLPVLLYDPVRRAVAAVHAGWRGTALGIVRRAVEQMAQCYGSRPEDILAAIGPGISKCCFETHEDVPNAMTEALGACALRYIEVLPNGKFHVDLKGLNALRLEQAGVRGEHIAVSPECTVCRSDKYWSHRVTRGERGSQAALIQLLPEDGNGQH